METISLRLSAISTLVALSIGSALCQVTAPKAGLTVLGVLPVPNWATSGANQEATDLSSFDPLTQVLYYADRVNHAVLAIDTKTNSILGWVPVPNCVGSCPSGVLAVPDLGKLVVTDRATTVYIYDLNLPGSQPVAVTVPTAIDELDYDPIHQRVYIGNTTAPFFMTGIDLTGANANTVTASLALPGAPEQPRFNPVDGLIYLTVPSVGVLVFDPTAGAAGTGALLKTYTLTNCSGNGNWIDPVTNSMLVGCNNVAGLQMISLVDGSVIATFPAANTDDVIAFSPALHRWYTGSGSNTNDVGGCPATTAGNVFPILGVFQAGTGTAKPSMVGAECSGRNGSNLAIDPIHSTIFVPTRQYPSDPANLDSGQAGMLIFHDPTPLPATPAHTTAPLGSYGTADFAVKGRTMNVTAILKGVPDGYTQLVVTTTVSNDEVVPCFGSGGQGYCVGTLIGDPIIGGMSLLGNNGTILAKGKIATAQ